MVLGCSVHIREYRGPVLTTGSILLSRGGSIQMSGKGQGDVLFSQTVVGRLKRGIKWG